MIQHELAGGLLRDLLAMVLGDHREREIDTRGDARRRPHPTIADVDRVGVDAQSRVRRGELRTPAPMRRPVASSQARVEKDNTAYQDDLLSVALIDAPSQELFSTVDPQAFATEERQAVANYLVQHSGVVVKTTPKDLQNYDTYVKILLLKAESRYADWNDQDRYFESARLLRQVVNEHKKQKQDQLTNQLRDAEAAGDDARATELRMQLNTLIKEITRGQR